MMNLLSLLWLLPLAILAGFEAAFEDDYENAHTPTNED